MTYELLRPYCSSLVVMLAHVLHPGRQGAVVQALGS